MHRRSTFVAAFAAVAILASAGPASAHEEINPKTFPTGQATFLTLTVANEASVDLVRVALRGPAGVAFGEATRSPAGWSAASSHDTITWTGGAVKPHTFESWGFEIEGADQPATLSYKVALGYAGGKTDDHEVEVTAAAPGAGGAGTVASSATTSTSPATDTPATSPTTAAASPAGSEGGADGDSGTATAAFIISIVALVLASGALVAGVRRRGGGSAPNRTTGGGTGTGAAQDW
jgi:hypothetical protein